MATIHLPEFSEWIGSPEWHDHLSGHGTADFSAVDEGCPSCAVGPMLREIHRVVMHNGEFIHETWALQDGYGVSGFIPDQGWDWSGIRDSSPAAIKRMYEVITTERKS
jgi:hypothetical protein